MGPAHGAYPSVFVQTRSFCCSTRTVPSAASARTVTWRGLPLWETENSHVLASFEDERKAGWAMRSGDEVADVPGAMLGMEVSASWAGSRWEHP